MGSTYGTITVATTATLILDADNERKGSIIFNTSNQTVYLGMDNTVTTSMGLPLLANASFNNSGQNAVWKGAIWGIVAGTTSDCRFWEFIT